MYVRFSGGFEKRGKAEERSKSAGRPAKDQTRARGKTSEGIGTGVYVISQLTPALGCNYN
jgi:hypothetical protein